MPPPIGLAGRGGMVPIPPDGGIGLAGEGIEGAAGFGGAIVGFAAAAGFFAAAFLAGARLAAGLRAAAFLAGALRAAVLRAVARRAVFLRAVVFFAAVFLDFILRAPVLRAVVFFAAVVRRPPAFFLLVVRFFPLDLVAMVLLRFSSVAARPASCGRLHARIMLHRSKLAVPRHESIVFFIIRCSQQKVAIWRAFARARTRIDLAARHGTGSRVTPMRLGTQGERRTTLFGWRRWSVLARRFGWRRRLDHAWRLGRDAGRRRLLGLALLRFFDRR